MRVVGLIPARGGSKRLPGKNLRYLGEHPLIHYTIEAALLSELDAVYVSTEDDEIRSFCSNYIGLHVIERPDALADDLTPTSAVVTHALEVVNCDRLMLLQPTSPLRTCEHINAALHDGRTLKSVYAANEWVDKTNGAIYLMDADNPMVYESRYIMSAEDSIDIDLIEDFERAEEAIKRAMGAQENV